MLREKVNGGFTHKALSVCLAEAHPTQKSFPNRINCLYFTVQWSGDFPLYLYEKIPLRGEVIQMKEVDVEIHRMPKGCPAFDGGNRYGYGVTGQIFGCISSAKNKEEIVYGIRRYMKSEEEYYNGKIKLENFSNSSDLDITSADIKGDEKLMRRF